MSHPLLLAVILVAMGCHGAGAHPDSDPKGLVTVATFTGVVDTEAGVFDIRVDPPPRPGSAAASLVIDEPTEVTVTSAGAFFDQSAACLATGGSSRPTWGASVTITNHMAGTTLGAPYAEITEFVGGTGLETCSTTQMPAGISNQYGAWPYGTVAPGATSTAVTWRFKYASATRFTFRGRIVAVKVDTFDSGSTVGTATPEPVDAGTYMVYADNSAAKLWFVDASGTRVSSTNIAARATALAVDRTHELVWYTTVDSGGASWIGHVNLTGGEKVEHDAAASYGDLLGLTRLAADAAASPGRAFAYSSTTNEILVFNSNLGALIDTLMVDDGPLAGLAMGPLESDGRRYVYGTTTTVAGTNGTMQKWNWELGGGLIIGSWDVGIGCAGPRGILLGPDGKMWFKTTSGVCTAAPSGAGPSTLGGQKSSVPGSLGLCTAPDGTVWAPSAALLQRVGSSTTANWVVSVTGTTLTGCSSGAGYLWGLSSSGTGTLVRLQP